MPAYSPPSPRMHPAKRARQSSPDKDSPPSLTSGTAGPSPTSEIHHDGPPSATGGGGAKVGQSSNFRNVSACNRCRLRKNRCDQKLPSCASCEKANVACVGYDPITKKEIPRRLVVNVLSDGGYLGPILTMTHPAAVMSSTSRRESNSSRLCCAPTTSHTLRPITWNTARGPALTLFR